MGGAFAGLELSGLPDFTPAAGADAHGLKDACAKNAKDACAKNASEEAAQSARPGRVVGEVLIDEPYPRTEAFRSTPRYSAWCVQVSRMLRSDAGGA